MPHWIKAHQDDPDCPPMRQSRPRPPGKKAVKYLRERYKDKAGDMQPLARVCDILDNPKVRPTTLIDAARLAHEIAHGKISPAQTAPAVQVNQQVVQANATEVKNGQLQPGERAARLAGLLKATAVLGDVCEGNAPGGALPAAGGTAPGGAGQGDGGAGGGGGAGA